MVLEKGRIVEFETPDELIKDNEYISFNGKRCRNYILFFYFFFDFL